MHLARVDVGVYAYCVLLLLIHACSQLGCATLAPVFAARVRILSERKPARPSRKSLDNVHAGMALNFCYFLVQVVSVNIRHVCDSNAVA